MYEIITFKFCVTTLKKGSKYVEKTSEVCNFTHKHKYVHLFALQ